MESDPTVSYLVSAGVISNADVETAVAAYLAAPDQEFVPLGPGYQVDISAAIASHSYASKVLKKRIPRTERNPCSGAPRYAGGPDDTPMTGLETAFILIGLFAFIAIVAYAAEGGPVWMIAAVIVAGIAIFVPWRIR